MVSISSLHARQILDSRGIPTVEVECTLSDGAFASAAVPSGASTGTHEALELRDGDKKNYGGKSVEKAVSHVDGPIANALRSQSVSDQRTIDQILLDLDGTPNKSKLGANAILAVSMAVARVRAVSEKQPLWRSLAIQYGVDIKGPLLLPVPLMNVLNGGMHADSGLSFQEFMIVPVGYSSFKEALQAGAEVFYALKNMLKQFQYVTSVGDEGGFAPQVADADHACSILMRAIELSGHKGKVRLAFDCAASEFYKNGKYQVDGKMLTGPKLIDYYGALVEHFPIVSIEDSHSEDDWDGFGLMQERFGSKIQLVGDDLFVTNTKRIAQGVERRVANAVLIKLNQIGTVSETVDAMQMCQKAGWNAIVSHRSGETSDTFIADLAVGLQSGQIKTGSLSRTERLCKYNQLLRIEESLGKQARYESPFGK
ncbi:phosphopyruvate hydratase [Candidatus Peribacteria bacterium RIFCSPHIGHO2_02_FULL_53_20]|nr:MAG: phosphopyruvate hydratase [Candidatus Peribacteria bacterium RIFCSPHIGHO2_02_FULL_53_20]